MSAPPPIPPTAHPQPATAPPPKAGLSGCAIAAIIGAVLLVLGIAVIGILAAIAVPQYQEYTSKSRVALGYLQAQQIQGAIDMHVEEFGSCPDNAALELEDPETFELGSASSGLPAQADVRISGLDNGHCVIEMTFNNIDAHIDGKTLVLESTGKGWTCYGGSLDGKYRPAQCRASKIFNPTDPAP